MPCPHAVTPAGPATALLIEDAAHLRYALRELLEADGEWTVVGEAGNGVQGRDLAAELHPDVIVVDNEMPIETGLEALPELRRLCPDATIVMWTSSADLAAEAQAMGADALVDKADSVDDLKDALRDSP